MSPLAPRTSGTPARSCTAPQRPSGGRPAAEPAPAPALRALFARWRGRAPPPGTWTRRRSCASSGTFPPGRRAGSFARTTRACSSRPTWPWAGGACPQGCGRRAAPPGPSAAGRRARPTSRKSSAGPSAGSATRRPRSTPSRTDRSPSTSRSSCPAGGGLPSRSTDPRTSPGAFLGSRWGEHSYAGACSRRRGGPSCPSTVTTWMI
mmetsp:Transcript_39572/g.93942  ORF Transcript_39572/g.93942 Transcript_39572/m.93942 type:complete len:206 (-) Transcript_39572:131-748(-)